MHKPKPARERLHNRIWHNRHMYLMLLPVMSYFIIFKYLPMGYLAMAFYDYKLLRGFSGSKFVGWKWFEQFITSMNFSRTIWNTLALNLLSIATVFPMAIVLALLINEIRQPRLKKSLQTITYMPYFISTVVVVSMIQSFLSPTLGPLAAVAKAFGKAPYYFMGDPGMFRPVSIVSGIWQTAGFNSIIYLSTISMIDPSLYEAATIDGASRLKRVWHVTLPGLKQTIMILFILRIGDLLGANFEKVLLMQNDLNMSVSELLPTYVYKLGMEQGKYSYSTAVGLFNGVVSLVLVLLANTVSKKMEKDAQMIF
jgi:putative aldouronate transport system permease protein